MSEKQPSENYRSGVGSQMKRSRSQYEDQVGTNPKDYEAWHKYIDFEKSEGNQSIIRQTFERAVHNIPIEKKRFWWPDYIYLWLTYARFEEFEAKDIERAREVYSRCIQLVPHKKFSFVKVWVSAAQLEIRQSNFGNARIMFESAIEKSPAREIFKRYIEMELKLGHIRRSQTLFMRYVQWTEDDDYSSWIEYTEFERSLSNPNRARFIYDIAVSQPALHDSKPLWNSYIDFEISEGELERARELFERLLERMKTLDLWIKYARFEISTVKEFLDEKEIEDEKLKQKEEKAVAVKRGIQRVRDFFKKAIGYLIASTRPHVEERARAILLEEWENLERGLGSFGDVNLVFDVASRLNRKSQGILLS